ncbi:hypothetical protein EMPS_09277 [Entomortierella parvispora]|uniref:Uncharacterized protein n=1 Tax=Entomortierella parvispora TaxID=205924 RepID=A0A9P3HI04_9FUNG|nr:hypothetical protein EMPS_09277 [Entomortierella parvispora]
MMSSERPAPTHNDFIDWAEGRRPRNAPHFPTPQLPNNGGTELVSQPFCCNVQSFGATGADIFRDPKNHPDAVGTILTYAATMADFFPAKGLENQTDQFTSYIEKVCTFPGFMMTYNEQSAQEETSVNIDTMINEIKSAYEGVVGVNMNQVVDSINQMANSILNHSSKSANKSVFTQSTITEDNGVLVTSIFYTNLRMELTHSGKKTYSSQSYSINRSVLKVLSASLVANADKLNQLLGDGSYDKWAKGASSPSGGGVSCFEAHAAQKANREQ